MNKPEIIKGALSVDDRGKVSFVNDFKFDNVKRFYIVENHKVGFVRAWHAHKNEDKYVYVIKGSALVGSVEIDDWNNPSKTLQPNKVVLSDMSPSVYFIPKGHANGFMSLTNNLIITFFSTSPLNESIDDDYRFESNYWDIWDIEER